MEDIYNLGQIPIFRDILYQVHGQGRFNDINTESLILKRNVILSEIQNTSASIDSLSEKTCDA